MSVTQHFEDGPAAPVGYILGVDLGQARDYTAIAVNEAHAFTRVTLQDGVPGVVGPHEVRRQRLVVHNIRFLERLPLGTSYPDICRRVAEVLERLPPMKNKPVLAVDQTGVGRPVLDQMREIGLRPIGVTISAGLNETRAAWNDYRVPKKVLASMLHVALDGRRLKFAAELRELDTLTRELASFRVKATSRGNETFEAWREREHDDLVLALALAVWGAEKEQPLPPRRVHFDIFRR